MTVVGFSCLKVLVVFLARGLGMFLFLLANFLLYLFPNLVVLMSWIVWICVGCCAWGIVPMSSVFR